MNVLLSLEICSGLESMADKKTYYYLKLKEGFFDSEDMLLLQGMKDGYIYSDILLKLYLMSLRQDGRLMYVYHMRECISCKRKIIMNIH